MQLSRAGFNHMRPDIITSRIPVATAAAAWRCLLTSTGLQGNVDKMEKMPVPSELKMSLENAIHAAMEFAR